MKCPYLTSKYAGSCSVNRPWSMKNVFELENYCSAGRHMLCPYYLKKAYGIPLEKRFAAASTAKTA